ncbi:MAG: hypothetical protein AAGI15_11745 [Pseudomonadota bacterium]
MKTEAEATAMYKRTFRAVVTALLLLGSLFGGAGTWAQDSVFERSGGNAHDAGRIEQVNFANGTLIIDGLRYWAAHDITVEINDSYGALTMLRPGMYVRMFYRMKPGGQRELYRLEEETDRARHHDT